MTEAERQASMNVAKTMSIKDLKWQIANAKKLRVPSDINQIFKDVLSVREMFR